MRARRGSACPVAPSRPALRAGQWRSTKARNMAASDPKQSFAAVGRHAGFGRERTCMFRGAQCEKRPIRRFAAFRQLPTQVGHSKRTSATNNALITLKGELGAEVKVSHVSTSTSRLVHFLRRRHEPGAADRRQPGLPRSAINNPLMGESGRRGYDRFGPVNELDNR